MWQREEIALGPLARGLVAGAIGTAVMTARQKIIDRVGSHEESNSDQQSDPWENAPAPAQVAKRILEGVFRKKVPADRIELLTNLMHWLYGTGWGVVYGLVEETVDARPLVAGPVFGGAVWAGSANDLGYHLSYGLAVAVGHRALERSTY